MLQNGRAGKPPGKAAVARAASSSTIPAVPGMIAEGAGQVHRYGASRQRQSASARAGTEYGEVGVVGVALDPMAAHRLVGDHADDVRHAAHVGDSRGRAAADWRSRPVASAHDGRAARTRSTARPAIRVENLAVEQRGHPALGHRRCRRSQHVAEVDIRHPGASREGSCSAFGASPGGRRLRRGRSSASGR